MGMPKHLSPAEIEELGHELDEIRSEVTESLGDRDRAYILAMIRTQRTLALGGRALMMGSLFFMPWLGAKWWIGAVLLAFGATVLGIAKIVENMEIGHNVMHAQWDWMRDPNIQSNTWEWDNVCPSDQWKHSHNVVHHTWTNVLGKDPDVGYGVLRLHESQLWEPAHLLQPLGNLLLMVLFEWGVAVHDLEPEKLIKREKSLREVVPMIKRIVWKATRQLTKDLFLWPLLGASVALIASPTLKTFAFSFGAIVLGNTFANLTRNVWSNMIIFCGHFPEGVHHFTPEEVAGETRSAWYVRQILGSCNIGGSRLFHILSGNLSHQIEHHLFPDMPSNRYPEIAPRIRSLCARYGLPYNTGSLSRQFGTTTWKIFRFALPNPRPA